MKVARAACFAYDLPLVEPLQLGAHTLLRRTGWLVQVQTDDGREGWGDVAPLPGFSRESPDEAFRDLQQYVPSLVHRSWPDPKALEGASQLATGACSSVRFGIETAIWTATAGASAPTSWRPDRPTGVVQLAALLTGTADEVLARARVAAQNGYGCVKIKVGRQLPSQDAALVRQVRSVVGPAVALRLDANRAWTMADATAFAAAVGDVKIAFVEEPLRDKADLRAFHAATHLPLALDETIQQDASEGWWEIPGLCAVVIKPTLVGGVRRACELWRAAEAHGMVPVMSSAYESGVGVRALAWLAGGGGDVPAGLDTYRSLASDVLEPRLPLSRSAVTPSDLGASRVQIDRLRSVL